VDDFYRPFAIGALANRIVNTDDFFCRLTNGVIERPKAPLHAGFDN